VPEPRIPGPRIVVIGMGNPHRGDDGAGRAVARRLHGRLADGAEVFEHDGEATALMALLEGADRAIVIDACRSGAPPGTVRRLDAGAAPLPRDRFSLSTHGLGLAAAIELGRVLGQLPPSCIVYAIEVGTVAAGAEPSAPVAAAIGTVCERVLAEVAEAGRPHA
jgi:hydrogenase maturation protease